MKYLFYILITLSLFSCQTLDYAGVTNQSNKFYFTGQLDNEPYYDNRLIGEITSISYEYYRGKKTVIITIDLYNDGGGLNSLTPKLLDYARKQFPRASIKINPIKVNEEFYKETVSGRQ